jgi:hypothetical protein
MAKPGWLIINPTQGSGNGTITNSANAHTGRVARTGIVTVTGIEVPTPVTYKVIQEPKLEFVSYENGTEMSASKEAGKVTVVGKSNSAKLTFSWLGDSHSVSLPNSYSAGGIITNNGSNIEGDPGASAEYSFTLELDFPKNDTIDDIIRTLIVTANGGQSSQIAIVQAEGDARLSISPTEITIPQDGSTVSVVVTSNTTWTVS